MKKIKWIKRLAALGCAAALLAGLTACGTAEEETDSSAAEAETEAAAEDEEDEDSGDSEDSSTSADISEIIEQVEAVTDTVDFFAEDFGSVDAQAALEGKNVLIVAYDSTNDWCVNYALMAEPLYELLGAEADITYCDGTADSWIQAIENAINQGYDAIDLYGIADLGQLENVIQEATDAGIYVQDAMGCDLSDVGTYNTSISVGCDYRRAGELMAMQVIYEAGSPEDVNCLVVADVGYGSDDDVREGITSVFDEYGCDYTIAEVSITDWTEGIGEAVRNAFIADSSYNSMISFYDNMLIYAVSALEELAIDLDTVYIGSFDGSPSMVEYIAEGKIDFDIGESTGWIACHDVDCMARYFAGQEVYNDSGYAMYFITSDNVENYLDPETGDASYAYDGVQDVYLEGYSELWGVDLTGVFDDIE